MCNTFINEHGWYSRNWGTQVKWGGMLYPTITIAHGSQFADVVKVLRPFMMTPDVGIEIDILGEKLFLYAFTLSHNDLQ